MKLSRPQTEGFRGNKWDQSITREVNRRPRTIHWSSLLATGSNTTGSEVTLLTLAIPFAYLPAYKWGFDAQFRGTFAANANNKTVRVYFGPSPSPTLVFDSTARAMNGGGWAINVTLWNSTRAMTGTRYVDSETVWVARNTTYPTDVQAVSSVGCTQDVDLQLDLRIVQVAGLDILGGNYRVMQMPGPDYK